MFGGCLPRKPSSPNSKRACFPTMRDGLATALYERHIRMARGTGWTATQVMRVLDRVRAGASGGLGKKSKPQHRVMWRRWKADTRPSCGGHRQLNAFTCSFRYLGPE